MEVDFVLKKNDSIVAIEIKSNSESQTTGLKEFKEKFKPTDALIVGDGGIDAEEFMTMDLTSLF